MEHVPFIPFNLPAIGQEEIDEVVHTLRSGWITSGPKTAQFEREFREYVQASYALGVNSATSGLHLALAALDIGPGDEVITTPLTFCSTVNTIIHVGATPVLADILEDGNIDPASIAERVTDRTRAIVPVHIAGLSCDMDSIWRIAAEHGLHVIEDAAHAVGTHYKGHPIGADRAETGYRSDAVVFSFYATKNLTTGEGGMVVTPDAALYERMKVLCLHGISKDAWDRYSERGNWYYEVKACGFKYNLSDIQSAIGIHQLRKQEEFLRLRTQLADRYNQGFAGVPEVTVPPADSIGRHSWHLYCVRLNLDLLQIDRAQFIRELHQRNIGSSVHFIPIPLHPFYANLPSFKSSQYPVTMQLYPRLVSLPLYPTMTNEQVDYVVDSIKGIVSGARKPRSVVDAQPV